MGDEQGSGGARVLSQTTQTAQTAQITAWGGSPVKRRCLTLDTLSGARGVLETVP